MPNVTYIIVYKFTVFTLHVNESVKKYKTYSYSLYTLNISQPAYNSWLICLIGSFNYIQYTVNKTNFSRAPDSMPKFVLDTFNGLLALTIFY